MVRPGLSRPAMDFNLRISRFPGCQDVAEGLGHLDVRPCRLLVDANDVVAHLELPPVEFGQHFQLLRGIRFAQGGVAILTVRASVIQVSVILARMLAFVPRGRVDRRDRDIQASSEMALMVVAT